MIKYAKVINEQTKACDVGLGTNTEYYISLGMTEQDVEEAYNGQWYLKGYAPVEPTPTIEEQLKEKEIQYNMSRWQHEYIVANSSLFPEFVVDRAQELEDLAEELRRQNENI